MFSPFYFPKNVDIRVFLVRIPPNARILALLTRHIISPTCLIQFTEIPPLGAKSYLFVTCTICFICNFFGEGSWGEGGGSEGCGEFAFPRLHRTCFAIL